MKRMLALVAAGLLVMLYLTTLICAILNTPYSMVLFRISITLTVLVPVLIAGYQIVSRAFKDHFGSDSRKMEPENKRNSSETNK